MKDNFKGWLAIAKLKPISLFIPLFYIVKCFLKHIGNREMKSESAFSLAMASQPFENTIRSQIIILK